LALADDEGAGAVVPSERDGGVQALFVAIAVAFVFVEGEGAVGTGIDAQFDGVGGFFVGVLEVGAEGDDGGDLS